MKLRVISDVHSEYYHGITYKNNTAPDFEDFINKFDTMFPDISNDEILVLGGDIGVLYDKNGNLAEIYNKTLEYFSKRWKRIIYVPGNHEYYNLDGIESISRANDIIKQKCESLGIHFLQKETLEMDGYTFVGCTLWSDLKYDAWVTMNPKNRRVFKYYKYYRNEYTQNLEWLKEKLTELRDNPNVIVVTHYVPLYELIHEKFRTEKESSRISLQASNLESFIVQNSFTPKYWICGHSHESSSLNKFGINFVLNPLGRYFESRKRPFSKELIEF